MRSLGWPLDEADLSDSETMMRDTITHTNSPVLRLGAPSVRRLTWVKACRRKDQKTPLHYINGKT